eukprot:scaffold1919_cov23-Tisochrysis_lutea.AAC.2
MTTAQLRQTPAVLSGALSMDPAKADNRLQWRKVPVTLHTCGDAQEVHKRLHQYKVLVIKRSCGDSQETDKRLKRYKMLVDAQLYSAERRQEAAKHL